MGQGRVGPDDARRRAVPRRAACAGPASSSSTSSGTTSPTPWPAPSSAAASLGVSMATVHTLGGAAMLRRGAGRRGRRRARRGDGPDLPRRERVRRRHRAGRDRTLGAKSRGWPGWPPAAGLRGVVCSPAEVEVVRPVLGTGAWIVVPGIRRAADAAGDQVRIATPARGRRPRVRPTSWSAGPSCRPRTRPRCSPSSWRRPGRHDPIRVLGPRTRRASWPRGPAAPPALPRFPASPPPRRRSPRPATAPAPPGNAATSPPSWPRRSGGGSWSLCHPGTSRPRSRRIRPGRCCHRMCKGHKRLQHY